MRRLFGESLEPCRRRPGAYGITIEHGRLLVVRGPSGRWHLPGGGLEDAETPAQALHREVLEETGLAVVAATALATAGQYQIIEDDEPVLKECHFFTMQVDPKPAGEAGETLAWVAVAEALQHMAEAASAWAVNQVEAERAQP